MIRSFALTLPYLAFVIAFGAVAPQLSAAQVLGEGYSCSGDKIIKKGKTIKLSVAKAAIQAKINAITGNSPRAKATRNGLKDG